MSFDLDDPLGDLLSDGSNDSFFGETPKKSTVGTGSDAINKKDSKLTTSTPKVDSSKSKLDELFGIKTQDDPKTAEMFTANIKSKQDSGPSSFGTSTRAPGTPQQNRAETPAKSQSSSSLKKSQTFDRDDDILSDLGFDIKPKPKSHSKASILDEIMGVSEQAKPSSRPKTGGTLPVTAKEHFDLRPKTSSIAVNQESNTKIESSTMMSRQSTITSDIENVSENTVLGGYTPSIKRSGRRQSTVPLKDPLGLYSQPEEPKSSVTTTDEPKIPKREEIPQKIVPTPAPRQDQIVTNQVEASPNPFNYDNKAQLFVTSTLNTDNAISSLKQQEMQLAVAAQIKSQELALTDMQNRQETLLKQQELQFNELLQKQLQRQAALEENIKRQQERINAHINLLMTQPASALYFSSDSTLKENKDSLKRSKLNIQQSTDDSSTSDTDINKSEINFKTEIKQLELEKLRLEDLLSNINANHENEINFMENSYKKQIKLLEESLQKTEERLRAENKSLQEYYFHKIDDIENEKQHLVEESNAKLKAAKDEYEENIKEIKKKYENDLETMENNYKDMIQNIRQSKLLEFSVLQENGNYLETLRNASKLLENANEGLGTLKIDLHEKIENVYHERESQLRMREMKVEKMENLMLKDKEKSDEERSQLLELVKSLEIKLNSLEQTSNEENWNLKQKFTALEVEKASFEREKTFIREQLTREQKRIEELKQLQSVEYDRQTKQIEEERMNLITEKAKLETNLRLQKRPDLTTSRAEIEAALKVAEEAGRHADMERDRLIDLQKQYETKRRELLKEEHTIRSKESELNEAINAAVAKEKLAETALKNARTLERNILIKLQVLQRHKKELQERESKISIEKLHLSRERMQIEEQRRKTLDNRCSLCKIDAKSMEISNILTNEISPSSDDNIDTELNKLRNNNSFDEFQIDLNNIPNLTDASDNLLDADLLLLKFDILNSTSSPLTIPNIAAHE